MGSLDNVNFWRFVEPLAKHRYLNFFGICGVGDANKNFIDLVAASQVGK